MKVLVWPSQSPGLNLIEKCKSSPVSMILVVFGGVNHRAGLHTNLLEQVPNFLINVLLWETNRQKILAPESDQKNPRDRRRKYWRTFPVMTIQPSWSMMRTSSWDGGWQNFCCRICRMGSITRGVSLRATAMCPNARMVWSGMRWASLQERDTNNLVGIPLKIIKCQIFLNSTWEIQNKNERLLTI